MKNHFLFNLFVPHKAETPVLWPPHGKSWVIGKDSDAGRDWGQEEKGTTEDEMAGWHHWLDGRKSQWTPGVVQGGLACCDSWGCKESDTTEQLIWSDLIWIRGFPGDTVVSDKVKFACQCRRWGFDLCVGKITQQRKWQPTLVFLHEKSHRQRSLAGYSPWGHKE